MGSSRLSLLLGVVGPALVSSQACIQKLKATAAIQCACATDTAAEVAKDKCCVEKDPANTADCVDGADWSADLTVNTKDASTDDAVKTLIEGSKVCSFIGCKAKKTEAAAAASRRALRAPGVAPKPVFGRRLSDADKSFAVTVTGKAPADYEAKTFSDAVKDEVGDAFTSVEVAAGAGGNSTNSTNDTAPASLFNGVLAASAGVALSTLF